MSLIQEALKRQQQEEDGTLPTKAPLSTPAPKTPPAPISAPPAPEAPTPVPSLTQLIEQPTPTPPPSEKKQLTKPAPSVPQPQPVTKVAPAEDKRNNKAPAKNKPAKKIKVKKSSKKEEPGVLPAIAGMILLVILLLASVGGAVIYGLQHFNVEMPWKTDSSTPEELIAETDADESTSEPIPVSTGEDPKQDNTPLKQTGEEPTQVANLTDPPPKAEVTEPIAEEATKLAAEDTTITTAIAEDKIKVADPVAVVTPPPAPKPPAPKPPVTWPPAKLKGVVGSGRGGAAMINNTVAGVNEKVDGILIVSIEAKGAWLEYKKERRFLKVGKSFE